MNFTEWFWWRFGGRQYLDIDVSTPVYGRSDHYEFVRDQFMVEPQRIPWTLIGDVGCLLGNTVAYARTPHNDILQRLMKVRRRIELKQSLVRKGVLEDIVTDLTRDEKALWVLQGLWYEIDTHYNFKWDHPDFRYEKHAAYCCIQEIFYGGINEYSRQIRRTLYQAASADARSRWH